jgi:cell division protein FtsL
MTVDTNIRLATLLFQLLSSVCVIIGFCILKFNDFNHVDKRLGKLEEKVDEAIASVNELSNQVSNISGYIQGQKDKLL